jgi:hypothetical protein
LPKAWFISLFLNQFFFLAKKNKKAPGNGSFELVGKKFLTGNFILPTASLHNFSVNFLTAHDQIFEK